MHLYSGCTPGKFRKELTLMFYYNSTNQSNNINSIVQYRVDDSIATRLITTRTLFKIHRMHIILQNLCPVMYIGLRTLALLALLSAYLLKVENPYRI